jgi:RNA polymerase sigma-70 factor (ECF subfamily)
MKDANSDLDQIYHIYFNDIYHYLLYFTNSQTDAEDLTQETFIKVFKHHEQMQNKTSVKAWIFSIAKNVAIDFFRKKKTLNLLPEIISKLTIADKNRTEDYLEKKQDWEQLQKALLKLKPNHRNVIILRGLKEMSISETAEILGWTEAKVKVTFHRAIKEMQKHVYKNGEGGWFIHEKDVK